MAGHSSEKRWTKNPDQANGDIGVSDQVQELCIEMVHVLTKSRAAYLELQEMFASVGTIPQLADQLFKEQWEARSVPGVNATLTVDVLAGVVTAVAITNAGTGYTDGTGYILRLTTTAASPAADCVLSYDVVSGSLTNAAIDQGGNDYTDGVGQVVQETPLAGVIYDTGASAQEVTMVTDMADAIIALNELHRLADDEVVEANDRYSALRRMS